MFKTIAPYFTGVAIVGSALALAVGVAQAHASSGLTRTIDCPNDPGIGIAGPCSGSSQCTAQCAAIGLPGGGVCLIQPQYGNKKCCVCRA